ncbi:MAG: hypothetical protein KDA69_11280 [Planctomycetaceae bacterium]|nr:hypothetical protein [Planctomycetaceae bacterium]
MVAPPPPEAIPAAMIGEIAEGLSKLPCGSPLPPEITIRVQFFHDI